MNKKYYLMASFLGLIITTLVVSSLVGAAEDPTKVNIGQAEENLAKTAFWQNNQEQMTKMHELMQTGDIEGAKAIREEMGLPVSFGHKFMDSDQGAIKTALDNNDYEAWSSLMLDKVDKLKSSITEDNFAQMVKMHELMQTGDKEGAQAIAQELELPEFGQFGRHHFQMFEKNQPAK